MTRGERVIAFIERYCPVPEGKLVGKPMRLEPFQKAFILDVYDNPRATTRRAYLSMARKNGKTALIAALVLVHLVGPEAQTNSQLTSGARSRDQAALVFSLAEKMVRLSPELSRRVHVTPSHKQLTGLAAGTLYKAISAEAGTAHGLSPVLAILDEVGQIKGPTDSFVEAIETAQGAHDHPILIAISTQAAADGDLFSIWLDAPDDPEVVKHIHAADEECDLDDTEQWKKANPAIGVFRSYADVESMCKQAMAMPSKENTFRWLFLNQRVSADAPFVSRKTWAENAGIEPPNTDDLEIYAGLDLSEVADLTAWVEVGNRDGVWDLCPTFWLPEHGIEEKSKHDRVPYDVWNRQGHLELTPGKTVDYEFVAQFVWKRYNEANIRKIAFDRWNFKHLKPWLKEAGFPQELLDEEDPEKALFIPFGQGYQSMSPALRDLESLLLNQKVNHGAHPLMTMCAANARVSRDPAGNRKLDKIKSHGRIDGMVALTMAMGVAPINEEVTNLDDFLSDVVSS